MPKTTNIVISAMGADRPGIVDQVSGFILDRNGNIENSRMAVLGGEFAVIMQVSGKENHLKEIMDQLKSLEKEAKLTVFCRATDPHAAGKKALPYRISMSGMDHQGVVFGISSFLAEKKVNIESLESHTYQAPITGASLFKMEAVVSIPSDIQISAFHKALEAIGEEQNFDIRLEPVTPE